MTMRVNSLNELPEHLREQAREKLGPDNTAAKDMKYHNIKTEADGYVFASQHEAERYGELKLLYVAKEVAALTIQVPFFLPGGIIYIADFVYYGMREKRWVVEDAKGCRTDGYVMKKKLMREIGIEIQEV